MKKPVLWTILVVAVIVLVGIGMFIGKYQASSPPVTHHKTTPKPKTKAVETTTAPAPVQEETTAEKVSAFSEQIMPTIQKINNDENEIGSYAREGTADPSIINDQSYRDNVRVTCMDLATNVAALRAVPEPTDPQIQTVWQTMQNAADDLDYVATNYAPDVENMNTSDLSVVADKMGEAGQLFISMRNQITNLITE